MTVNRRLACENSRFFVYFDEIRRNRKPHTRDYLVVAPKHRSRNMITGVAILPIVDGKIALLKVFRHAVQYDSWEIPRGFVAKGESDVASALRELKEEMGLTCDRRQIKSLGFVTPDAGVLAARVHLFGALHCLRSRPYKARELGHLNIRLFKVAAINELIHGSRIQDPYTIVAYYKLKHIQLAVG
jgi:ADP-ribose pyrophosphatase